MAEQTEIWPGWQTVRTIGRGSYGSVYEIEREILGVREKAAVKCISLPPDPGEIEDMLGSGYDSETVAAHYEQQLRQIAQEYALMAELRDCRYVVRSEDLLQQRQDNGLGWDVKIKMELLQPMMRAKAPGTVEQQALRLGQDLCLALIECKNHNIVHRDIKPQNIFLAPGGDYKLGDFGIARTMEKTTGATKTGTYNYMAPEVYHEQPYGHQADVYSLGMVLYWMLNERRGPFLPLPPSVPTAAQQEQARSRRLAGEPLPPPKNGSEALKAIVLRACACDAKDRYAHAGELYNELEELRAAERERIAASGGVAGQNPSGPAGHLPFQGRQEKANAQVDRTAEQERIATPVTRSLARNDKDAARTKEKDPSTSPQSGSAQDDKDGSVGAIHESPAARRTTSPHTVGADASGGPMGGRSVKQNPSGPAGHLHPPLCPPRGHLSPPGRVFPLQGRQEPTTAPRPTNAVGADASPPGTTRRQEPPWSPGGPTSTQKDPSTPLRSAQDDKDGSVGAIHESPAAKPKKKSLLGLVLGLGAAAVLLIAALLLLPRLRGDAAKAPVPADGETPAETTFSPDAKYYEAGSLTYILDGTTLTVTGTGKIDRIHKAVLNWVTESPRITSVRIGEGVTGIGDYAFSGCSAMTSVAFPESLTQIGNGAFQNCRLLESAALPAGVTGIGSGAFLNCSAMESVAIPEELRFVGENAFYGCDSLTQVQIHSLERWCGIEFVNASANPLQAARALYLDGEPVTAPTFPAEITEILPYTFCNCATLQSVTIPAGVTVIGEAAFSGCGAMTSVTIPASVTKIGASAFRDCIGLTDVVIPEGVTEIDEYAFDGCGLQSVTIPASVTTIYRWAFARVPELTDVYYGGSEQDWTGVHIGYGNFQLDSVAIHFQEN